MANEPENGGQVKGWTPDEVLKLRKLAREGSAKAAAAALGRSLAAVTMKAMKSGISFRPAQPVALRKTLP
jgi:hypothetical protein